jgi:hypothetical protein
MALISPAKPSAPPKKKGERQYGEYRTRRLVLEAWDAIAE